MHVFRVMSHRERLIQTDKKVNIFPENREVIKNFNVFIEPVYF